MIPHVTVGHCEHIFLSALPCFGKPFLTNVPTQVTVDNPKNQPGVILADNAYPMQNLTFDGVKVINWKGNKKNLQYFEAIEMAVAQNHL